MQRSAWPTANTAQMPAIMNAFISSHENEQTLSAFRDRKETELSHSFQEANAGPGTQGSCL